MLAGKVSKEMEGFNRENLGVATKQEPVPDVNGSKQGENNWPYGFGELALGLKTFTTSS